MTERCPTCGQPLRADLEAAAALVQQLRDLCREAGHSVSLDDRVDEAAAAACLGLERATLKNRRYINGADFMPFYKHGRSVSYRLEDIAARILAGRVL